MKPHLHCRWGFRFISEGEKLMQCKKKLFSLAVVFIMLFAILVPDTANVVNAKTKQSTIKKKYASYIKKNAENDLG